jgi:hypothetical protein
MLISYYNIPDKIKMAQAVIIDYKGDTFLRKTKKGEKFGVGELQLMVGGDYIFKPLSDLSSYTIKFQFDFEWFLIKKPYYLLNKYARQIPLTPNEKGREILKRAGIMDLPLGNFVIVGKKYLPL